MLPEQQEILFAANLSMGYPVKLAMTKYSWRGNHRKALCLLEEVQT